MKIHLIAAARPNFMKIAPLYHCLKNEPSFCVEIVHTGQHYDANMSECFFEDFELPSPHHHLNVGSGTQAEQVGLTMISYEKLCQSEHPDLVVVVGDVNATIACTMAAKKLGIKVAHLEAGIRSFDESMPEEINRLLTDKICDYYWTPSLDANQNLINEGVNDAKISFVGNVMIDTLINMKGKIEREAYFESLALLPKSYAVLTFHRPSNVDCKEKLEELVAVVNDVSKKVPIVFPMHPRTMQKCREYSLLEQVDAANCQIIDPLNYLKFISLVFNARLVITDSGGIQEETTYLGIPCLTVRDNTERPITITEGTNTLTKLGNVVKLVDNILSGNYKEGSTPERWDGKTAERVKEEIIKIA